MRFGSRAVLRTLLFVALGLISALVLAPGGCGSREPTGTERVQMRVARNNPAPNFEPVTIEKTHEIIYLSPDVAMTGRDVKSAEIMQSPDGWAVAVHFTDSGADKLQQFTTANKGRRIAILVDGRVFVAPLIIEPLKDGQMLISRDLSASRARALAEAFSAPVFGSSAASTGGETPPHE